MADNRQDFLGTMAKQLQTQGSVNLAFAQKINSNETNITITQGLAIFAVVLSLTALVISTKQPR